MPVKKPLLLLLAALFSLAFVFSLFGNSLGNDFAFDDFTLVVHNPKVTGAPGYGPAALFRPDEKNYLPVRALSYRLDFLLWGLNPAGFRVTNLLIHSLNVFLVFLMILRIGTTAGPAGTGRGALLAAALGAALFAAHPLQVESVTWVSGRKDLLAAFFTLAAFHFFLSSRLGNKEAATHGVLQPGEIVPGEPTPEQLRKRNILLPALTAVSFSLAVMSHAAAVCFPLAALLFDLSILRGRMDALSKRRILFEYSVLFLLMAAFAALDLSLALAGKGASPHGRTAASLLPSILRTPWFYLKAFAYPLHLGPEYQIQPPAGAAIAFIFTGAAALAATLVLLFRRNRLLFFFAAWFLVFLLPVSNIFPIENFFADRYAYIPMAGLCALAAATLAAALRRPAPLAAAALLILVPCSVLTLRQNRFWRDDFSLWTHAMSIAPDKPRVFHNIGEFHRRNGDPARALSFYYSALEKDPDSAITHQMVSQLLFLKGDYSGAERHLRELLRVRPDALFAYHNLARILVLEGKHADAISVYRGAAAKFPGDLSFRTNLRKLETQESRQLAP